MERMADSTTGALFYSNVCHVCQAYGKDIKLKRCINCKQIAYCSKEHQKEHWPQHKDFCQAICILQKPGVVHELIDFAGSTRKDWMVKRYSMSLFTKTRLGRELLPVEKNMLAYPRCCKICQEMDFFKLHDCSECPDASFCIKHPKDSKHAADCEKSKLRFEINNMTRDMHPDWVKIISLYYSESIPKNMDEAIGFILSHFTTDEIGTLRKLWVALIAEWLTRVYTFLYSMEKLSRPKSPKLKIHAIGGDIWEIGTLSCWQYLFHHDESLKELEIVLISPELSNCSVDLELCNECEKNNHKIDIEVKRGFYAEFAASRYFTRPDFVVAFNLDIRDFAFHNQDIWSSSIRAVAKIGCPFVMTACSAEMLTKDGEKIDLILGKKVKSFWAGENPFPGGIPNRDFEPDDLCCNNEYLAIYKTLS